MSVTQPIETIKKELTDQVIEGVEKALKTLKEILSPDSKIYTDVIKLLGQYNTAHEAYLIDGVESREKTNLIMNRIQAAVLELIKELQSEDISESVAETAATAQAEQTRQGSILYRIPTIMTKDQMTKCVVRIALNETEVAKDIERDEHVKIKELDRVSETMKAEIIDPTKGKNFDISPISDEVQLIPEAGYTEWWFYVTPLADKGNYPLVLKVSIIQMVNGEPEIKNIPMEEVVKVVVDGPVEEVGDVPLKPAAVALNFQTASLAGLGLITGLKQSAPAEAAKATSSPAPPAPVAATLSLVQKVAITLLIAGAGAVAGWFLTPEPTRDWWKTRYVVDTVEGYTDYMNKYPAGPNYETAGCRKAELLDSPAGYRSYLIDFPEGYCRSAATEALERLEKTALAALEEAPTKAAFDAFMTDFPGCASLDRLYNIVEKDEQLKRNYSSMLLQRWEECRREDPQYPPVPVIGNLPPVVDPKTENPTEAPSPRGPDQVTPNQPTVRSTTAEPAEPEAPPTRLTPQSVPKPPAPGMVSIKGGTFQMGAADGNADEQVHEVTLRDFHLGKHEVTFEAYDLFCEATGRNKPDDQSFGRGQRPVIWVSWLDAVEYCNWLSQAQNRKPAYTISGNFATLNSTANGFRLPTEAEWEFAARGGATNENTAYSGSDTPNEVGWFNENSSNQTHPVGHLKPNALGIYDMSGNVREWCSDRYLPYSNASATNPLGPPSGVKRIFRGGFWGRNKQQMRVSYRNHAYPDFKDYGTGFRLAHW